MNKTEKTRVKEFLPDYLQMKGLPIEKAFRCINPEHEDRHPSMSYDKKRCKAHCFSCGADYDLFDCISILEGFIEMKDVFQFAERNFLNKDSFPYKEKTKSKSKFNISNLTMTKEGYDYLISRGISREIADRFNIVFCDNFFVGLKPSEPHWKAVIIPTGKSTFTARNIASTEKAKRIRKYGGSPMFNTSVLYENTKNSPVFVTEGEFDALSFYEADADAMALGSTVNSKAFLSMVNSKKPSRKIILCLDNDEWGRKAQSQIAEGLSKLGIPYEEINVAKDCKDINEALTSHPSEFFETVREINLTEEYATTEAKLSYSHASALTLLSSLKIETYIPTHFKQLDNILGGGLYNDLYILGGGSSVGKTSFALQLADQIASHGTDVLFYTLEMSSRTMVAKSISRITYQIEAASAMTARQITSVSFKPTAKQTSAYKSAVTAYSKFGSHVFMAESLSTVVTDIINSIKEHIRLTGNTPVVFIDYLQLLDSDVRKNSDKQNVDACVRDLKRACRELSLPIIAISSFSRSGYKEEAAFESFKESGSIEYSSDVLLALQFRGMSAKNFDINSARKKPTRDVELVVLKNRNGISGEKIQFSYIPKFDTFNEI